MLPQWGQCCAAACAGTAAGQEAQAIHMSAHMATQPQLSVSAESASGQDKSTTASQLVTLKTQRIKKSLLVSCIKELPHAPLCCCYLMLPAG